MNHFNREENFTDFYNQYAPLVKKVAFSVVKNEFESEDITQIVFTKIHTMEKELLPTSNVVSWLYTVTKNTAIDYIRKNKPTVNLDCIYTISDKEDKIDDLIDAISYNQMVSSLPQKEQEILALKLLSNLSFKEIGQLLGLSTSTVSWTYYKSLKTLKLLLGNFFAFLISFGLFIIAHFRTQVSIKSSTAIEITENMPIIPTINPHFLVDYLFLILLVLLISSLLFFLYFNKMTRITLISTTRKSILTILLLFFILSTLFFGIDYLRALNENSPLFCIEYCRYDDGGTKEYYGLGYKVIDYHKFNEYDKTHIGTFFLKYDKTLGGVNLPKNFYIFNNEIILE